MRLDHPRAREVTEGGDGQRADQVPPLQRLSASRLQLPRQRLVRAGNEVGRRGDEGNRLRPSADNYAAEAERYRADILASMSGRGDRTRRHQDAPDGARHPPHAQAQQVPRRRLLGPRRQPAARHRPPRGRRPANDVDRGPHGKARRAHRGRVRVPGRHRPRLHVRLPQQRAEARTSRARRCSASGRSWPSA